jgi:UDP-N-acetylmuramoylalanine--D-glutamate ligase
MPAIIVCRQLDIPVKVISDGIKTYKPLPHRLEAVGKYDKILFYNDSISTIPESTIAALKALENVDTLILGGFDRGLDYKQLFKHLTCSGVRNLIFLDKAGERMLEEINGKNSNKKGTSPKLGTRHVAFFKAKDMNEAVKLAKSNTAAGKICLLSQAAASYGMFKDFEDRGNTFVKLVKGK